MEFAEHLFAGVDVQIAGPRAVRILVLGIPAPQGSKKAFILPGTRRTVLVESSAKLKPWRERVAAEAQDALERAGPRPDLPFTGPVRLRVLFAFPRPASHYGTRRGERYLKPTAPGPKISAPDLSKLVRAVEDALTGIIYEDDRQIAAIVAEKCYVGAGQPAASITVEEFP